MGADRNVKARQLPEQKGLDIAEQIGTCVMLILPASGRSE
jgi:hypothetical protein